ncbi:MAG: hypothetical protein JXA67_16385, partial [Micromonosporaceae bacterium]|nr:hypothetical protein [Micromonosporaceae bacterium]
MADGDGPVVEVPATGETPGPSETLEVPNGSARTCGYSRCGRILRYDGRGRPPEYCADRRWPDGRTCKQLAAAERAGERAIGLDLPLEAFRAVSDRLQPVAEGLARQLVEVSEAVGQVRDGALARIAEAERAATEAIEAVRGAEAQRDQALAAQRAADDDAAQAAAAAEEAQQRAAAAQA